jgi:hypothetical protein
VLTASGHPPRRTLAIVKATETALDLDLSGYAMSEYRDLRSYCLSCAENSAEVRRCAIINCPFWPYRMGKNPQNPQRGKTPTKALIARGVTPKLKTWSVGGCRGRWQGKAWNALPFSYSFSLYGGHAAQPC